MKLRKIITVSAAALMLAGIGASATSAGAPVHASKRTVRVSRNLSVRKHRLERQDVKLGRQLKSNHFWINQINREMARLGDKNVKHGKRSKKTVKHHKRTKKGLNKHAKKVTRRRTKRSRKSTNKVPKGSANQQAKVMTRRIHVGLNNNVYTVEVKSNGKTTRMVPNTQKYVSSMKDYAKKYTKPFLADRSAIQTNLAAFKKTHNMQNYVAAVKADQDLSNIGVTPLRNNQSTQK